MKDVTLSMWQPWNKAEICFSMRVQLKRQISRVRNLSSELSALCLKLMTYCTYLLSQFTTLLFWKLKIWMPHFYLSSLLNNNFRSEQAGFPWKNNTYGSFTLNTLMILSLNRWHSLRDRENCIIIVLVNPHATTLNADKNHNGTYMSFLLSILWNYYYIV